MGEQREYVYALCVEAKELLSAIKRVQFAIGKDGCFTVTITSKPKEDKVNKMLYYTCTLSGVSENLHLQAVTTFFAQMHVLDVNEKGEKIPTDVKIKSAVSVTVGAFFADVVATFAEIESNIFLTISKSIMEASNIASSVPIPIKEKEKMIPGVKSEKMELTIDREQLVSALKYVSLAADANSRFGNCYGFLPIYDSESPKLRTLAMTDHTTVMADIAIENVPCENYATTCDLLNYAMVDAAKVDQIFATNDSEKVKFIVFFQNNGSGNEILQVVIKTFQSMYMFTPQVQQYPASITQILCKEYETRNFNAKVSVEMLKKTLPVLGLGCDLSKDKKVEMHFYKDHLLICDEGGLKSKGKGGCRKTKINQVEIELPKNEDEAILVIGLRKFLKSLKPYEKSISIIKAKSLIVFEGNDERIKHALVPCLVPTKDKTEEDTDINGDEE